MRIPWKILLFCYVSNGRNPLNTNLITQKSEFPGLKAMELAYGGYIWTICRLLERISNVADLKLLASESNAALDIGRVFLYCCDNELDMSIFAEPVNAVCLSAIISLPCSMLSLYISISAPARKSFLR